LIEESNLNTSVAKSNTSVPGLIVVCGPTATGKSGLAIALAQKLHSVILSADSRQVYREFNIGTAKPTEFEQQQVPHYLIDVCDPTETLTLAEYQEKAQCLIAHCHDLEVKGWRSGGVEGKGIISHSSSLIPHPLLVGGTGLYIKSIVRGLKIPRVPPQPELREQLKALGQTQCYAFLRQVDPISAQRIHANDETRTLRALEVFYTTGRPISAQQGDDPPNYPILQIGLDCAQSELLTQRIQKRTQQMVEMGLVEEVEALCQKYGTDLPLLNTLGYQEMKQYLAGEISLDSAIDLTVIHTRQFAKRQRTWFRADPSIEWFDADAPDLFDLVWGRVQEFLRGCGV
jgi:tRNA dimethylallyltransferase